MLEKRKITFVNILSHLNWSVQYFVIIWSVFTSYASESSTYKKLNEESKAALINILSYDSTVLFSLF